MESQVGSSSYDESQVGTSSYDESQVGSSSYDESQVGTSTYDESQVGSSSYDESQVGSRSYDVFINFRGEDTRNIFIGHLYRALMDRGIHTFIDSQEIWKGDDIGPVLLQSIKGSKISIAVLSKRYTESRWCLRELSQMMECHENNDQIIIPIFFKVTPSDVKGHTGRFEISPTILGNETDETINRWKDALRKVGSKTGWVYNSGDDASKLVDNVVEDAWNRLDVGLLTEAKHPVGVESRVDHVLSLVSPTNSKSVQFIGIYGMGGSGKTTIATGIYNRIRKNFKKFCFLENIRGQASQSGGIICLQEKLFKKIFSEEKVICSGREGSGLIKKRLGKIDVLLILDDVRDRTQLEALSGDYLNSLSLGSKMIITSRDRDILDRIPKRNKIIYENEGMEEKESLQLFSLHAFLKDQPPDDYKQLSIDIVGTTGGLPLALEVLGSELYSKDRSVWESMLERLKEFPHGDVYGKLKISYDSLDIYQKAMFLDVACFFIGWKEETVISIWKTCDFHVEYCIDVLQRKSLLKIRQGHMWMHDQIRDMGRSIAGRQRPSELHQYCRLWSRDNIVTVVNRRLTNQEVEGILCSFTPYGDTRLHMKGFKKMHKLRLLQVDGATLEGSFEYLPLALRWLRWRYCPLKELSANFYHEELIRLDLSHGKFRRAWNEWTENKFLKLKVLEIRHCQFLFQSPDFSGFPCLKRLDLSFCKKLINLDESIGQLKCLDYLNLEYCISLNKLPDSIGSLSSLEKLILRSCQSLKELPTSIGDLKDSLVELVLDFTKIKALPDGVGLLKKLKLLDLSRCRDLVDLPRSMENMASVHYIDLSGRDNFANIPELPSSVKVLFLRHTALAERFKGFIRINQSKNKKVDRPYVITNYLELRHGQGTFQQGNPTNKRWRQIWIPLQKVDEGPNSSGQLQDWRDIWIHLQEVNERPSGSIQLLDSETSDKKTSSLVKHHSYLIPLDEICSRLMMHIDLSVSWLERNKSEDEACLDIECLQDIECLNIEANIHRKDKKFKIETSLKVKGIKLTGSSDHIVYFHEFEGFDWFGFQLEGGDAIEILNVRDLHKPYDFSGIKCIVTQLHLFLIKDDPHTEMLNNQSRVCHYDEGFFELIRYMGEDISELTFEQEEEQWTSEPTPKQEEEYPTKKKKRSNSH